MAIDFAAGEIGGFDPADSQGYETTDSGKFDSSFARCALSVYSGSSYIATPTLTSRTEAWLHFELDFSDATGSNTATIMQWFDSGSTARLRLQYTNSGDTLAFEYWNGSAWTSIGSVTVDLDSRHVFDIHAIVNSASGSAELYIAGNQRISGTGLALSGAADLTFLRFYGTTSAGLRRTKWSQVIVANESTVGMRLITLYASGAGSDSAWSSGTYASIDEIVYSDADFISSASANQVSTFAATAVSSFTGYTIKAICVTARAKKGASGPTQLQLALRVSGTNYFSSSKSLTTGYAAKFNVWDTSPATSAAWTVAEMSGLQFGVKSIT